MLCREKLSDVASEVYQASSRLCTVSLQDSVTAFVVTHW